MASFDGQIVAHNFVKVLSGVAGAYFLYAAVLLYEDEQGRIHTQLQAWWSKVDDLRGSGLASAGVIRF